MKRSIFYLILSGLLFSNMLYAQEEGENRRRGRGKRPSVEEMAAMQTTLMTDSLALTEDQVVLVEEINLKYAKLRGEIMENEDLTREERSYDMETLDIKKEKEFKKILDKDQYKKYVKMEEDRKARWSDRRGGPPPDGGPGGFPGGGPPNGGNN